MTIEIYICINCIMYQGEHTYTFMNMYVFWKLKTTLPSLDDHRQACNGDRRQVGAEKAENQNPTLEMDNEHLETCFRKTLFDNQGSFKMAQVFQYMMKLIWMALGLALRE